MALAKALAARREESILAHCRPYLDDDERVVSWARARSLARRRDGFLFVTERRCVVHWTGREDGHFEASWDTITSWGVDPDARGGPILQIENGGESTKLQLRVSTVGMANAANDVLRYIADRVSAPRHDVHPEGGRPLRSDGRRPLRSKGDLTVTPHPRSIKDHTRRILVTVIGVVLVVGGIVITPLPGPWSLPIILGGLAVLASEYDWAQDLLNWVKHKYAQTKEKLRARRSAG